MKRVVAGIAIGFVLGVVTMFIVKPAQAAWTPNDPFLVSQVNLQTAQFPDAWTALSSAGVTRVGLLDTGDPCVHADLVGRCDPGWVAPSLGVITDENGHATQNGGILAAATNNGIGIAGAAPNARIVPIKACNVYDQCTVDDVLAGIHWAIAQGDIKVINASLVSTTYVQTIQDAICDAQAAGITVVAAAGNYGNYYIQNTDGTYSQPVAYPLAAKDCMVVVGGTSTSSSRASWVDVVSEDQGVLTTGCAVIVFGAPCVTNYAGTANEQYYGPTDVYTNCGGTSCAAPTVAGLVAIMRAQLRAWCGCANDVAYLRTAIRSTADAWVCRTLSYDGSSWTETASDGCGGGHVNAAHAVAYELLTATATPLATVTATATAQPTATRTPCPSHHKGKCR